MDIKSKEEYLMILAEELKYLKKNDLQAVLDYYNNKISSSIDYGEKEIDVILKLPTPEEVAKEQYENHGVRYLELRKRELHRKEIINRILNGLMLIFITIAEIFTIYILIRFNINILKLAIKIFNSHSYGYLIAGLGSIFYFISSLLVFLYIIDLFFLLWSTFFQKTFKLKDETRKKLNNISINLFIDEKLHKKKVTLKVLITFVALTLIFFITSGITKGYLYKSINNVTSLEERIELTNFNNIKINSKNLIIKINKTEESNYLIYNYEFNHNKNINIVDNTLNIELEDNYNFDLLNILNEPTQRIELYLNETTINKLDIELISGNISIENTNIDELNLNSSTTSEVVIASSNLGTASIKGSKLYLGITNSKLDNLEVEATSGQNIIEKNSEVNNIKTNITGSIIKYTDSIIHNLDLKLNSSTVNMNNIKMNEFKLNSVSSRTNLTNTIIDSLITELYSTSYLESNVLLAKELNVKAVASYVLLDYFKSSKASIDGTESYIFLTNLKKNKEYEEYNNYNEELNLTTVVTGNMSKTQIGDSNIDYASISQIGGYLLLDNVNVTTSTVSISKCKGVEYNNIDGDNMTLDISGLNDEFSLKSDTTPNIKMRIIKCDTLSFAYVNNKGNYDLILDIAPKDE